MRECAQALSSWSQKDREPNLTGEMQELPAVPSFPLLAAAGDVSLVASSADFHECRSLWDRLAAASSPEAKSSVMADIKLYLHKLELAQAL